MRTFSIVELYETVLKDPNTILSNEVFRYLSCFDYSHIKGNVEITIKEVKYFFYLTKDNFFFDYNYKFYIRICNGKESFADTFSITKEIYKDLLKSYEEFINSKNRKESLRLSNEFSTNLDTLLDHFKL